MATAVNIDLKPLKDSCGSAQVITEQHLKIDEVDAIQVPERSALMVYLEQHIKDIVLVVKVLIAIVFVIVLSYLLVHNIIVEEQRKKDIPDYLVKGLFHALGASHVPISNQRSASDQWIQNNGNNSDPSTMSPEILALLVEFRDFVIQRHQRA